MLTAIKVCIYLCIYFNLSWLLYRFQAKKRSGLKIIFSFTFISVKHLRTFVRTNKIKHKITLINRILPIIINEFKLIVFKIQSVLTLVKNTRQYLI